MRELQDAVLAWYAQHGRAQLPWRRAADPYRVFVSEYMLQQTQVDRVIPAFEQFIERFDSFASLAAAERAEVVRAWKGLGYNARAIRMHEAARTIVAQHGGVIPESREQLRALPGFGPYMTGAIRAFAFGLDDVALDVNLRRVMHRLHFGPEVPPRTKPAEVEARARALLPPGKAAAWNAALMDLGAMVCTARAPQCLFCPLRPWCAAAPLAPQGVKPVATPRNGPQARLPFPKTRRYARGRVLDRLRELAPGEKLSPAAFDSLLAPTPYSADEILAGLERDGFLDRDENGVRLRP